MKKTSLILLLLFTPCVLAQTTLYTNVNGYTLNTERQLLQFSAIQFSDGKIDRLFQQNEEHSALTDVTRIDGLGKTLIPGLIDAHGHVLSYGLSLLRVDLTGTSSEQDAVTRVVQFHADNDELEWIQGRGWNQELWDITNFPSAASLDAEFPDKPVWLTRVDGHAAWANSRALELAGIDDYTPDPSGGQIIRDANGKATGVLVDNAMALVRSNIPAADPAEQKLALHSAMQALAKAGLTSVHDAGVSSGIIQTYQELQAESSLPIRINAMLSVGDQYFEQQLARGPIYNTDHRFSVNSVKIAADGALGSRGAALIDSYSDQPNHQGLLLLNDEQLTYYMEAAMRAGFQVNTHAIGDLANKKVLDNYQQLIETTATRSLRHRVEHAQILRFEDISRFAEMGVIASMQATHATSDKNMAQDRLGDVRILGAYAWRKLLQAGTIIANGSDFPVESANPFFGLHAAVTRQDKDNQPEQGWFPEERMTVEEAFASFTLDAAYAGHQEGLIGSLEAGKLADFILLDQDIFNIAPSEIWKTEVLETWVSGELIQ